jgi:hypothetical protein
MYSICYKKGLKDLGFSRDCNRKKVVPTGQQ